MLFWRKDSSSYPVNPLTAFWLAWSKPFQCYRSEIASVHGSSHFPLAYYVQGHLWTISTVSVLPAWKSFMVCLFTPTITPPNLIPPLTHQFPFYTGPKLVYTHLPKIPVCKICYILYYNMSILTRTACNLDIYISMKTLNGFNISKYK